jgi:small subunit ribosomal protein S6
MAEPLPKHRSREYETIFILNPDLTNDAIEQVASRFTEVITRLDGKLLKAENWGRRRLAYTVKKFPKGFYVYLRYLGYSDMVHELERNMRMLEPVIKYLTVKLEEDVNPDARPVRQEDISFLPKIESIPEKPEAKPAVEDKLAQEVEAKPAETTEAESVTEAKPAEEGETAPAETTEPAEETEETKAKSAEEGETAPAEATEPAEETEAKSADTADKAEE